MKVCNYIFHMNYYPNFHYNRSLPLWCPTLVGEENKSPFIRVWKPSPSRRVLKPWGEAQTGQYLLAVDLGRYSHTILGLNFRSTIWRVYISMVFLKLYYLFFSLGWGDWTSILLISSWPITLRTGEQNETPQ